MKIKYLIDNIDLEACYENASWSGILSQFDFDEYNLDSDKIERDGRLKVHHYHKWCCTDTWVGYRLYSLDGMVVAWSGQIGRKYEEEFEWVSKELYESTNDYLRTCLDEREVWNGINLINMDQEIPDYGKIDYSGQFLDKELIITETGEKVTLIKQYSRYNSDNNGIDDFYNIIVKSEDGREWTTKSGDVHVPYPLKQNK